MPQHTLTNDNLAGINAMNLTYAKAALNLGRLNRPNVKAEFLPELDARLAAIADRVRRLEATERSIRRETLALRKGGR